MTAGGTTLGTVNIRRGIFQGDSLSPLLFVLTLIPLTMVLRDVKAGYDLGGKIGRVDHLLFMDDLKLYGKNEREVDTLAHTVRVFSEDIGMQFGINKCAVLIMKKGKMTKCEEIKMPDGSLTRNIDEGDVY